MNLEFDSDISKRKKYFTPESFSHPAKMHLDLLEWIVLAYTDEGDTILDPMFGSGTTLYATLFGRDVIGVELEDRFVGIANENRDKLNSLPLFPCAHQRGKATILQGDARNLMGLFADNIITSPPYSDSPIGGGLNTKPPREGHNDPTGRSPRSQSQLGAGTYDKVITSPPYAGAKQVIDTAFYAKALKDLEGRDVTKENAGLRTGEDDPGSITNLPYGSMDTVVTSPPYEGSLMGDVEDKISKGFQSPQALKILQSSARGYSKADNNIGNLKSDSYLQAMLQVYRQCYQVLKPGGLCILVTKDFIRKKKRVNLAQDTITLMGKAGFKFKERHLRVIKAQSFWRILYQKKYPEVEKIDGEDVLVFSKEVQ